MPFLHERLDNGLDVIAETSPAALSTSVGFFVTTGARDEDDALWGASHFLEHMVFKGTADLSADDINRRFDALGAAANAFTSEEDTVYYAAVLPRHQHEAVDLLARMMRPALRSEDFTTEKLVILEEIRMYDDQPPFGADDACRAAFFGAHPLARSVLGSVDSIGALAVEQLREYHARRYAPNELVLAAAGAVDFPALVDSARRLCGDWEPRQGPDRRVPGVPRAAAQAGRERIVRAGAALEYAVRMTAGPAGGDVDRWAAALLALVLGDASGSRLYWACVDGGDAEQASCQHHEFLDAGLFVTHLACAGADTERLLERILDVYRAAATGVAVAELAQARNKLAGRIVLAGERPRSRLFDVGLEWTHHGGYRSVADTLRLVEGLTTADLDRVLAAWPLDAPSAEVLAGPGPG